MIPDSYSAWRRCIEIDCGIPLTENFIRERIDALKDAGDFRTEQFIRCYGHDAARDKSHPNRLIIA